MMEHGKSDENTDDDSEDFEIISESSNKGADTMDSIEPHGSQPSDISAVRENRNDVVNNDEHGNRVDSYDDNDVTIPPGSQRRTSECDSNSSGSCEERPEEIIADWRRSIVVNDVVSTEMFNLLTVMLTVRDIGGGHITNTLHDPVGGRALITFEDASVAGNLVRAGKISFMKTTLTIMKPDLDPELAESYASSLYASSGGPLSLDCNRLYSIIWSANLNVGSTKSDKCDDPESNDPIAGSKDDFSNDKNEMGDSVIEKVADEEVSAEENSKPEAPSENGIHSVAQHGEEPAADERDVTSTAQKGASVEQTETEECDCTEEVRNPLCKKHADDSERRVDDDSYVDEHKPSEGTGESRAAADVRNEAVASKVEKNENNSSEVGTTDEHTDAIESPNETVISVPEGGLLDKDAQIATMQSIETEECQQTTTDAKTVSAEESRLTSAASLEAADGRIEDSFEDTEVSKKEEIKPVNLGTCRPCDDQNVGVQDFTAEVLNADKQSTVWGSAKPDRCVSDDVSENSELQVNELLVKAEKDALTLLINGIPNGLEETVVMFLESERKGGGKIASFQYDKKNRTAEVVFEEDQVARSFLEKKVLRIQGINVTVAEKTECHSLEEEERDEDTDDDKNRRTIVVEEVSEEMEDIIIATLESSKKNGGPIEFSARDPSSDTLTVCFVDQTVAEWFLKQRVLSLMGEDYTIHSPVNLKSDEKRKQRTILVHCVPERIEETLIITLESPRTGGGPIVQFTRDERSGLMTVTFVDSDVAQKFIERGSIKLGRQVLTVTAYTEDDRLQLEGTTRPLSMSASCSSISFPSLNATSLESDVTVVEDQSTADEVAQESVSIEVYKIPEEVTEEALMVLLESRRVTGVSGVQVHNITFFPDDHSRAVISFTDAKVAEALLAKQVITFKGHDYHVKKPSPLEKTGDDEYVEEPSPSETTGDDEFVDAPSPFETTDDYEYVEKPSPLETTGDVDEYVEEPSPLEKTGDDYVEESSPLKGREAGNTEPSDDDGNLRSAVVEVVNIPRDCTVDKLTMILENKRYTGVAGAKVEKIELSEVNPSIALVTFSDPEVAERLVEKREFVFKDHTYHVKKPSPPEEQEDDNAESNDVGGNLRSAVVEVVDIPRDCTVEKLTMVLENKRYTGVAGAVVENIEFSEDNPTIALVTFSDPEVAERLLEKKEFVFKDHTYYVKTPSPLEEREDHNAESSDDGGNLPSAVVEVFNIPRDCTVEKLTMVLENKRYTGVEGVTVEKIEFRKDNPSKALVTFSDPEVAERLLEKKEFVFKGHTYHMKTPSPPEERVAERLVEKKEFVFKDHTYHVKTPSPPEEREDDNAESSDDVSNLRSAVVEVFNIPRDCTVEKLTMILENKRYAGFEGVTVEKIEFSEDNPSIALVTFSDPEVAERLVEKKNFIFKGHTYHVKTPSPPEERVAERILVKKEFVFEDHTYEVKKPSPSEERVSMENITQQTVEPEESEMHSSVPAAGKSDEQSFDVCPESNTIKVSRIPSTISKDMLTMYFENKRRSGGGDIKDCLMMEEKGKAVITFFDAQVARGICNRNPHKLSGAEVSVTQLEAALDAEVCAIEVTGIQNCSKDYIELFFDNEKRSGGGTIEECLVDERSGVAVITFENADVVTRVLRHSPHKLGDVTFHVAKLQPAPPPPVVPDLEVDQKRLLAKRLPNDTLAADLQKFLSRVTAIRICAMTKGKKPSTALLDLEQQPDYLALRRLVSSRPFKGKMISIQRVPRTRSIIAFGIADDMNVELIKLYFENKKRSGGDEVTECNRIEAGVIITFKSHEVVYSVLQREQTLSGQPIKVQPYYKWLELPEDECKQPDSVTVKCNPKILAYVQQTPSLKGEVEDKLAGVDCIICWPKTGGQPVELKFKKGNGKQKLAKNWSSECSGLLTDFMDSITCDKIDVSQEIWNDFKARMNIEQKMFQVKLVFDDDKRSLHFAGKKVHAEELRTVAEKVKCELEQELQQKRSQTSESIGHLKQHQIMILVENNFMDDLRKKHSGLEVTMNKNVIVLVGAADAVKQAKLWILQRAAALEMESVSLSKARENLLKLDVVTQHLRESLRQQKVVASWSLQRENIDVYAASKDDLDKAVKMIRSEFVDLKFPQATSIKSLLSQPQWKDLEQKLKNEMKLISVLMEDDLLVISTSKTCAARVKEVVDKFFVENTLVERDVEMLRPVAEVIERYMRDDVDRIKAKLSNCRGRLQLLPDGKKSGFHITANEQSVSEVASELLKLAESVIPYDYEIDQLGIPDYLTSQQGRHFLYGIQCRNEAVIELGNLEMKAAGGSSGSVALALKLKKQVAGDRYVLLSVGDITRCVTDVIISPSDQKLMNVGGVAVSIVDKAGEEVRKECRDEDKNKGADTLPGSVFVSKAGRLPCKCIVHAVAKKWINGSREEASLLFATIHTALEQAVERGFRTVALPASFAKSYGFPAKDGVDVTVNAVTEFLRERHTSALKEVTIVATDDSEAGSYAGVVDSIQPLKLHADEEPAARGRKVKAPTAEIPLGQQPPPMPDRPAAAASSAKSAQASAVVYFKGTSKPGVVCTAEGVEVALVKGAIATLQVNVIVNTTSKDLNLSSGAVSGSILAAAGPEIQDECKKNAPPSFTYGDIIETKGYQLKADSVYHGACVGWDNHAGRCEQVMRNLLRNVLLRAHARKHSSLAVPAIGTGNLRIPPPFVASVMYDEVMKFSSAHAGTTLKDIRIVVYDKDLPTVKAFEDKIKDLISGAPPFASQQTSASTGTTASASAPTASSSLQVPQSLTGSVTFDQTSGTLTTGSVTMTVVQGDITKDNSDAIVNSTDTHLSMNGEVGKALLRAGGEAFKAACGKARIGQNRLCVTIGGDLPAKNVLHLAAANSFSSWKQAVSNCLTEAENRKWSSITFPVLGTGNRSLKTYEAADMMVEAVTDFAAKSPAAVKRITVCIFQPAMVQDYKDAIVKKVSPSLLQIAAGALVSTLNWFTGNNKSAESVPGSGKGRDEQNPAHQKQCVGGSVTPHPSCIVVHIYALNQSNINSVVTSIVQMIREYYADEVLDRPQEQELIAKLNDKQVAEIEAIGARHETRITVEKSQRINRIRITGPPKNVSKVVGEVHLVLQAVLNRRQEEMIASQAQWEYVDNGKFEPYPDEINVIIETAYNNKKAVAEWEEQDARFRIVFDKMVEETVGSTPISPVQVRRVTKAVELPSNWTPMAANEALKVVPLDPNDAEYKDVEKDVSSSCNQSVTQIIKIERIQNPVMFRQYLIRRDEMNRANPGNQNERKLWHGTSADTMKSINETGFNRSYCGKNATVYGRGVYFARDFCYSAQAQYSVPDSNGIKYVYQCLALTGEFTAGNPSLIVPPNKPNGSRYDSTVNDPSKPAIFVVFSDTQVYPQYLVSFK